MHRANWRDPPVPKTPEEFVAPILVYFDNSQQDVLIYSQYLYYLVRGSWFCEERP
jgi:hypothetical protein